MVYLVYKVKGDGYIMKNVNHADSIRNVLANEIVTNLSTSSKMLKKVINGGFKGIDKMSFEELTNTFIDMFGFDGYTQAISKVNKSPKTKYIAYFDASFMSHDIKSQTGYIGYAIRTADGKLVVRDAEKVKVRDIHVAESLALLTLLNKIVELGIDNVDIYGDNKGLIDCVNGKRKLNGNLPHIVNRMSKLNASLTWNSREENRYADMLCRLKKKGIDVSKTGGEFDVRELEIISARAGATAWT